MNPDQIEKEREAFEKWFTGDRPDKKWMLKSREGNSYKSAYIACFWKGWLARAEVEFRRRNWLGWTPFLMTEIELKEFTFDRFDLAADDWEEVPHEA